MDKKLEIAIILLVALLVLSIILIGIKMGTGHKDIYMPRMYSPK